MEASRARGSLQLQTRQPAAQSAEKRANAGSSKAAPFAVPLPLYRHIQWLPEPATLLYSLAWTLSFSAQALLGDGKIDHGHRNKVPREAYMAKKLVGYWDEASRSVWVLPHKLNKGKGRSMDQDVLSKEISAGMENLWTMGFFGKGSLSRSEPTWLQREKNRVTGAHGQFSRAFWTLSSKVANQRYWNILRLLWRIQS